MQKYGNVMLFVLLALIAFYACQEQEKELLPPVELTYQVTDASTYNGADGAISVTVSGGVPPISYLWSTGETASSISGLYAGMYTITVVYGTTGRINKDIEVGQPEAPPLNLNAELTHISRYGELDGSILLAPSDGTPPYSYQWDTHPEDTLLILRRLPAGIYAVTVTDNSTPYKIVHTESFTLIQPDFICGVDSIRDIDGNKYATVQLGDQCWLAVNLRTKHNPLDPDNPTPIIGSYCNGTNCNGSKGAHYSWDAMMNGFEPDTGFAEIQGICPDGWHLPTAAMWEALNDWLSVDGNGGPGSFAAAKMRGPDSPSGFDALYTGNWGYGIFTDENIAPYWAGPDFELNDAEGMYRMINNYPVFAGGHKGKEYGLNVRCIRNKPE